MYAHAVGIPTYVYRYICNCIKSIAAFFLFDILRYFHLAVLGAVTGSTGSSSEIIGQIYSFAIELMAFLACLHVCDK